MRWRGEFCAVGLSLAAIAPGAHARYATSPHSDRYSVRRPALRLDVSGGTDDVGVRF
jgi:hypothetical protein